MTHALHRCVIVKQERVKAQKDKKGKKAKGSSAGEAFLNTLFAP
jgi:large subunit ribosomal protein L4e